MKKLNVILVYNKEQDKILMCKREEEPYKGKYNLVGGKVELGEDIFSSAYRELQEETGLVSHDMTYLGETGLAVAYTSEIIYLYYN